MEPNASFSGARREVVGQNPDCAKQPTSWSFDVLEKKAAIQQGWQQRGLQLDAYDELTARGAIDPTVGDL